MADTKFGIYSKPDGYGVNGINGVHHADVLGWDNTTVGIGSSVYNRVMSQHGVQNFDPNVLPALEPLRAGRFILKWLKYPPFFNEVAVRYLKFFLEDCVRTVEGVPENNISMVEGTPMGSVQQEMAYPGIFKQSGKDVTLTTFTSSGDPLGKLTRYWLYGISDPVTGIGHLYGKNMRYCRPNYSGTFIYIFLGPTGRPGDIEFASIWHECFPTSGDGLGIFNSNTLGEVGSIGERTVTFSGIYQDGPEVNILAKYITAGFALYSQSYLDRGLPAYMYEYYVNDSPDAEQLNHSSIAADVKLAGVPEYDKVRETRSALRTKYGLTEGESLTADSNSVDTTFDGIRNYSSTNSMVSGTPENAEA